MRVLIVFKFCKGFTQCLNRNTGQFEFRARPVEVEEDARNFGVFVSSNDRCPPAPKKGYSDPVRVQSGWLLERK